MVLRLIERLWNKRLLANERDRKLAAERLQQERAEKEERQRKEEEARGDIAVAVLLSEEMLRFAAQLSRDLAAATTAALCISCWFL